MKNLTKIQIDKPNYSLTATILLFFIMMVSLVAQSQTTDSSQVWFTPNVGSVDMLDLFTQPEQWDSARSKIDVFKFYTGQVGSAGWSCTVNSSSNCGENHLQNFVDVQAFPKLASWGIDIAIESFFAGPVMSVNPIECSTSDYVYSLSLDGSINVIQSVQSNGGTVRYLAMDEPIRQWYPHYYYIHTGQTDPRPCLVDSLGELADHVADYIQQMQIWFPSVSIGHVELYPEVGVEQLKEWVNALEARGVSLSFLHIDVHGPQVDQYISFGMNIDVVSDMAELKTFLNAHNIDFGIILFDTYYDSQYWDPSEYNDSTYYARTMNWINFIHDANLNPDHRIFQSWIFPYYTTGTGPNEIPINLPENDSSLYSHTRLINDGCDILNSPLLGLSESLLDMSIYSILHQNYPNPFNYETTIPYSLGNSAHVQIRIYNILGMHIHTLIDEQKLAGEHQVIWNGQDANGLSVSGGIYICSMSVNGQIIGRNCILK